MSSLLVLECIDWRYSQSCWYFRPSFVNYCPSNLPSVSPLPPPSQSQSTVYTDSVWLGGGCGGCVSYVGDPTLQELNTLLLTRFRTYKIALPPQTKS
jgi:hypothetical protein